MTSGPKHLAIAVHHRSIVNEANNAIGFGWSYTIADYSMSDSGYLYRLIGGFPDGESARDAALKEIPVVRLEQAARSDLT